MVFSDVNRAAALVVWLNQNAAASADVRKRESLLLCGEDDFFEMEIAHGLVVRFFGTEIDRAREHQVPVLVAPKL